MSLLKQIIRRHDDLLSRETTRPRPGIGLLLFVTGVASTAVGWITDDEIGKILIAAGGFTLGLAAEKFAQYQHRRVENTRNSN